jgi:hypothetical protein
MMLVRRAVLNVLGLKGAFFLPATSATTESAASEPSMRAGLRAVLARRRALRVVLAALAIGLLSASSASPAVAEDTCLNATVRAQTNSTGLPDCRAYELVTPPYKQGFDTRFVGFTDDGLVSYRMQGNIAGNTQGAVLNIPYHAQRSAAGWISSPLSPPATMYAGSSTTSVVFLSFETSDLRQTGWIMKRLDVPGDNFGLWLRGPEGAFTRVTDAVSSVGLPAFYGTSADASHVVFQHGLAGSTIVTALWEFVGREGTRRQVSVDNQGNPSLTETCPRDMSADGRVIVYIGGCWGTGIPRLMARVGGSATVAVSGSECTRSINDVRGECNGASAAEYAGAAADGSRVFFTTSQQLVNGDANATNDLYACDIPAGAPAPVGVTNPCASLTQVSGTASDAQVERVVAVSEDGSRVYFVADGVLASNVGIDDVGARAGLANLYLWERDGAHPAGQTRFVTTLLGGNDIARAQMTPDNRYLLFQTANSLVAAGPGADTDGSATDAYRYDASTEEIVRVSVSASGGGNDPGLDASIGESSSMTSDGSTVIFDTAEDMSSGDNNGVRDVYAWRDGHVSLISAGGVNVATGGGTAVARISPSGRDIFFTTSAPVLDADRDVITDIYDARVAGGFTPERPRPPCSGDECQGQRSQPPGLVGPSGPGLGDREPVATPPTFSLRTVSAAQRKALAATGKVRLTVTANAAGTVSAMATATIGGRSVTVGSARRALSVPGMVTVALTLSKKARAQLAARGKLTVRVAISHSQVALDRSVTLRLVRARAKRAVKRAVATQRSSTADVGRARR